MALIQLTEPKPRPGDLVELPASPLLRPFHPDGDIKPGEVLWGNVKDCWLPALLAAMANTQVGRQHIRRMIVMNDQIKVQSTWGGQKVVTPGLIQVRFLKYQHPIKISRLLYRDKPDIGEKVGKLFYSSSNRGPGWVSFIEKAYVVLTVKRNQGSELTGQGYLALDAIKMDEIAIMQDFLLGPGLRPRIIQVRSVGDDTLRSLIRDADRYPTIATTPFIDRQHPTTKSGFWADHAYAALGLRTLIEKGKKVELIRVVQDGEPAELGLRVLRAEFHHVTQCRLEHSLLPAPGA